ncbi:hypothetical protein K1T71_000223 [Dendrolimus kikuchii]|uniref:Uncharacterized protein n=1 Tax=Dendrolimus kikuchii TaxID=765133 RepID=A0ACC1DIW1_9NEOP|nr:hypothetical protein K1T71_000223 [Dendrolimus kikuchii]
MGPKKGKDVIDENYWRTSIEEAPLDVENWKVKVVMFESAGSDQDRMYLTKFETFAAEERRFVIKNICKTETIFMVNQLGGERKVKDDNLRIFEEAQSFLKDKKDIPSDILALVIKHLILKMKDEYLFIKRQILEVREGMRRESTTMIDKVEVKGTVSVKPSEAVELPPPPPKGKGKKEEPDPALELPALAEGKKYNTSLRIRGEEWRDKVYVDDFPTDGPNIYVAVTGFVDPHLPRCLVKIGIPLTAVVQVRIDASTIKIPSGLLRPTKRGQSQTEILTEKSLLFWEQLQQFRMQKDTADDFKNTAFVLFSPPYWDAESLSGNPDKIYDEICFLMYDLQDLTRQHLHYLDNMDIINIPFETSDARYQRYYHKQIDDIPLECVTIYSVLDSILRTVSMSSALDEETSRSSSSDNMTINQVNKNSSNDAKIEKAEKIVKDVFGRLCKTDIGKKSYRISYGDEYENHKDPIVINYGDFVKNNTFHLGNINLDNIVWSTLLSMPINRLWQNQKRPEGELEAKINFHINVLLSSFDREDIETSELNRLIHILACRKLYNNRSSTRKRHIPSSTVSDFKKVYLKRSVLAEPLPKCTSILHSGSTSTPSFPSITKSEKVSDISYGEDPESKRIRFLFDCPDISELVSAAEIANDKPMSHLIDDFEVFEDFSGINAFQVMLEAFNKFNCVDYKYCEVTDCFILMFYNSHDIDGIAREEWRGHLPTPLCLQDFFDFVLEEHYDWIQNEERVYDETITLKAQSELKDLIDPYALKSCVQDTDVEMDLLMEGSLKYQEIGQIEEPSPDLSIETKIPSSKKNTLSPSSTEPASGSSKKTKSAPTSTPKNLRQGFMASVMDSQTSIQVQMKPFSGYNLGHRRVEVFGKDATYFSKDGTRITSKYTLVIPMNLEYINLNVLPGNSHNEIWVHRALGEFVTSDVIDMCESFRITTKDQVLINIKKQVYQIPLPIVGMTGSETIKPKEDVSNTLSTKLNNFVPLIFESKYFHSVFITWPNGLITESVYENNSPVLSHIKQYYVSTLVKLDEDMRCVTLNGEVIIFKSSGIIEVLKSDGSYIKIMKCVKKIVPDCPDVLVPSETDSEKSKKVKGKPEKSVKDSRGSKAASKSSRILNDDNDKISEEKLIEYELFIEEFEIVETNGLRQKWIADNCFDIEKLLIRTATDYCLGEIFSRRMDGVNILLNKDGVHVATYPNGTRIITNFVIEEQECFPEWTEEEKEYFDLFDSDTIDTDTIKSKASMSQKSNVRTYTYSTSMDSTTTKKLEEEEIKENEQKNGYISVKLIYTIEHPNFTTITINQVNGKISIDSPNNTTVTIDSNNHYNVVLDSVTSAQFDGVNLRVNYEACPECQRNTTCDIKIKTDEMSSVTKIHHNWLKMKDSFDKKIVVDEEGNISLIEEPCSTEMSHPEDMPNPEECESAVNMEEKIIDSKSESSVHAKCKDMYLAKSLRFFVFKRELNCSELVHRSLLEQYKQDCRWQPWCSISQYDTFSDHRTLMSLLTPVYLTETEKWLMDSKLADKPKYLTYKDLKNDCGKGFYHWMRPYARFEANPIKTANVLPARLPRAFVLRILEQQWKETQRNELMGAKELLNAILRYRRIMDADCESILNVPILDPRPEDERRIDEIIQALAHRIYEDLRIRLEDDVQTRIKPTITTKPPLPPEEMSVMGELEEESPDELKTLEEERDNVLKEFEDAEEMSPNLRRYWRRREEEFKEEQFYLYLLREGSVPPYFRNILGGAIWSQMNNAAEDAVTQAERRKMKCICAAEEGTSRTDETLPFM